MPQIITDEIAERFARKFANECSNAPITDEEWAEATTEEEWPAIRGAFKLALIDFVMQKVEP